MANEITLEIGGAKAKEPFNAVWVHLQNARGPSVRFKAQVPKEFAKQIFDPHETRETGESWPGFHLKRIAELGTFIVTGYFRGMAKACGEEVAAYRWVIASVDEVAEEHGRIELVGLAVPFVPNMPILVEIA